MSNVVRKKKLTRGEKWLLVAPLFCAVLLLGVVWFRQKTAAPKGIEPYLIIESKTYDVVGSVALAPDGTFAAILWIQGGLDARIEIYDTFTGVLRTTYLVGEVEGSGSIAISPDSNWLACTYFSTTRVWDLVTGTQVIDLSKSRKKMSDDDWSGGSGTLLFSPDSKTLALGEDKEGIDGETIRPLRLWNFRKHANLRSLQDKEKNYGVPFRNVHPQFLSNGRQLIFTRYIDRGILPSTSKAIKKPDIVQIKEIQTGRLLKSFASRQVIAFAVSPDEKTLVISDDALPGKKEASRITAYNMMNKSRKWTTSTKSRPEYHEVKMRTLDLTFAPDGETLACQDNIGDVTIRNVVTGNVLTVLEKPRVRVRDNIGGGSPRPALQFSANGEILLLRTPRGIRLWNTDDWKDKL